MAQGYAGVPPGPLSAWLGVRAANEQAGMNELQQAAGVQGLLAKMQAQKEQEQLKQVLASDMPDVEKQKILSRSPQGLMMLKTLADIHRKETVIAPAGSVPITGGVRGEQIPFRPEPPRPFEGVHNVPGGYITFDPSQPGKYNFTRTQREPAPPTAPAPSIKDIVDPKNPSQMISVDTRVYKAGDSLGDPGVLGVAGREPGAAKRAEKEEQGVDHLKSEIDNLRGYYNILKEAEAIPSSEKGSLSNIWAWTKGSTAGQIGGRMLGTKEQDARNAIQSSRMRLLNAIKNATGMSAQQLNSNIELQTWLQSLTDVNRSYESNVEILDKIESTFAKPKAKADAAAAPPGVDPALWKVMTPEEKALWQR